MGSSAYITDASSKSPAAEIGLNVQASTPPIAAYVGKDDTLWIFAANPGSPRSVIVSARLLMPDGTIKPNQWVLAVPNSRAGTYIAVAVPECFILSIAVTGDTSTTFRNQYVEAIISRGLPAVGVSAQLLCSGYPSQVVPISWPSGVNTDNVNCVGAIRSITGTTPGAGVEISESVPNNAKWQLFVIRITLTTSGTAGNRTVILAIDDGTNICVRQGNVNFQAASSVVDYNFSVGYSGVTGLSNAVYLQLPNPVFLLPGWRIRTTSVGLLAGDQYSAPQYVVQEWLLP